MAVPVVYLEEASPVAQRIRTATSYNPGVWDQRSGVRVECDHELSGSSSVLVLVPRRWVIRSMPVTPAPPVHELGAEGIQVSSVQGHSLPSLLCKDQP
ncbi:hypothetical protein VTI28DRAFT_3390 [Corynascus sepedonium]